MEGRQPERGIPWERLKEIECQGNSETTERKGMLEKAQAGKTQKLSGKANIL